MLVEIQALIAAAAGAGGVITATLAVRSVHRESMKQIATRVVLEHQIGCPLGKELRDSSVLAKTDLTEQIGLLRSEIRESLGRLDGRLDAIYKEVQVR